MSKMFNSKRKKPNIPVETRSDSHGEISSDLVNMFLTLQEKLNNPVFNGGFDKLLMKVDAIETAQNKANEFVHSINKTIYEPDSGLFSRIKQAESDNSKELTRIATAQEGLKAEFGSMSSALKTGAELANDFKALKLRVDQLEEWKKNLSTKLWVIIPIILTLLGKAFFDFISLHVYMK